MIGVSESPLFQTIFQCYNTGAAIDIIVSFTVKCWKKNYPGSQNSMFLKYSAECFNDNMSFWSTSVPPSVKKE